MIDVHHVHRGRKATWDLLLRFLASVPGGNSQVRKSIWESEQLQGERHLHPSGGKDNRHVSIPTGKVRETPK